jgi:hypothetical protein
MKVSTRNIIVALLIIAIGVLVYLRFDIYWAVLIPLVLIVGVSGKI